ncbi:MAG: cell-cell signaling protein, partial [Phormidesmis priestleyi]
MFLPVAMPLLPAETDAHVLVVGATQGIGLEFVKQLLALSQVTQLFATYRSQSTATALLALAAQQSDRLHCLQMDLTEESQIEQAMREIKQTSPKLHLVINCVGLLHNDQQQPEKALRQLNAEHLLTYFQ